MEFENEEVIDVQLARDLESSCDVTVTYFIYFNKGDRHDRGVDFTLLEVKELEYKEKNDLESDVTFPRPVLFLLINVTNTILVLISP